MQKIAIFGGTFNPIHNGHLHIAGQFAEIIGAQKVVLVPTCIPPHKQVKDLAPPEDRLAMCRLVAQRPRFEVSDVELRRGGPSYTSDTLRTVNQEYPESELYLLMGEDMFLTLEQWHEPEVIYRLATVCAAPRSHGEEGKLETYSERLHQKGAKTLVCPIDYLPVSSTLVREAVKAGLNISAYVPQPVRDYILKNHLYLE